MNQQRGRLHTYTHTHILALQHGNMQVARCRLCDAVWATYSKLKCVVTLSIGLSKYLLCCKLVQFLNSGFSMLQNCINNKLITALVYICMCVCAHVVNVTDATC